MTDGYDPTIRERAIMAATLAWWDFDGSLGAHMPSLGDQRYIMREAERITREGEAAFDAL